MDEDGISPPPPPMRGWLGTFEPFTPAHALVVLICFGAIALAVGMGLWARPTGREPVVRHVWVWTTVAWQAFAVVWWLMPERFDLGRSLPLQVCDVAAWAGPLALLTGWRRVRTVLYFWGIAFSTQAFFTPILTEGGAAMRFWLFWIGHTQIVGAAAYDVIVLRYRPGVRDFRFIVIFTSCYIAGLFALNILLGTNYAYVGPTVAERRTLVDVLGPWPLRVVWMYLIGFGTLLLAWGVWPIGRRLLCTAESPAGEEA